MRVAGCTMVSACFESNQCDQTTKAILPGISQATRLSFMFLVERQLLAKEQVLGDQRTTRPNCGLEKFRQLDRQIQESESELCEW